MEKIELNSQIRKYARLIVRKGCALKEGQPLFVRASIDCADFVRTVAEEAYAIGCKRVTVQWSDEKISRLTYENCPVSEFEQFPEWTALMYNSLACNGAAVLTIDSENPEGLKGIDPAKTMANVIAAHAACKDFYDHLDFGKTIWCIAGAPSPDWATKVFPNLPADEAIERLWEAILRTSRADGDDPEGAWDEHNANFGMRKDFLNSLGIDSLHYTNSLGTDLTIGLASGHIWNGGAEAAVDGREFFPNIPTEEIYTSPDRTRTEGIVYSAMPLVYQGNIIDDFWLRFESGKVVDFDAKTGRDSLESLIRTDEGSSMLGEAALVPFSSPINQTGILFYSTLYDENAVCHIALGKGFADCFEGAREMNDEQLVEHGINVSSSHVDFMIGTSDLSIVATTTAGERVEIFRDGQWAF